MAYRLSAIRASATRHGLYDLYLFAVLFEQVADVPEEEEYCPACGRWVNIVVRFEEDLP